MLCLQLVFFLGFLSMTRCQSESTQKNTRFSQQIPDSQISAAGTDSVLAETGFADTVQSGSKYFQDMYTAQTSPHELEFGHVCETANDWEERFEKINLANLNQQGKVYAHVPAKDHYEVGHKRGNEHHYIERHEKAHPHEGEFKTKVRWGDKHGGYGEHYWDYNHAGHDGHDGEETQNQEQYVAYDETTENRRHARAVNEDVEFINDDSKKIILSGLSGKHGGNYRRLPDLERTRRHYF